MIVLRSLIDISWLFPLCAQIEVEVFRVTTYCDQEDMQLDGSVSKKKLPYP
jgi:hypothetical protein